ncbi:hypothetical protein K7432_001779 [Basidiobolus ranarum]|uniref:Prokaryotic-type class I peptide chain release factors domain-containing protein n=1 Tax=Basidiobolus ranarum TaxID=34480 RepID=A0ABR2X2S9_9FUNG
MVYNPFGIVARFSSKIRFTQLKQFTPALFNTTHYTLRSLSHRPEKPEFQSQLEILQREWLDVPITKEDSLDTHSEDSIETVEDFEVTIPDTPNEGKDKPIKIILNEDDLVEKFVKGSGNGGQKINKTNSNVDLLHVPSGIRVQCQKTRSLSINRKEARKLLIRKLDDMHNGDQSKSAQKIRKIQKKKAKKARRTRQKYGVKENPPAPSDNKE